MIVTSLYLKSSLLEFIVYTNLDDGLMAVKFKTGDIYFYRVDASTPVEVFNLDTIESFGKSFHAKIKKSSIPYCRADQVYATFPGFEKLIDLLFECISEIYNLSLNLLDEEQKKYTLSEENVRYLKLIREYETL